MPPRLGSFSEDVPALADRINAPGTVDQHHKPEQKATSSNPFSGAP
jgi:hypothetical protein